MFYSLSKIAWFVATPSNLLPLLVLGGLLLGLTRFRRSGLTLAFVATVAILAVGLSPFGQWLILPLEQRFPTFRDDGRPIDGVVVLGGSVLAEESISRDQLTVNEAGERVIALADLSRRYPDARIVVSGGGSTLLTEETAEAAGLARFASALDVPPERLVIEDRSRTTYENAVFSRRLAEPRAGERWLLVTSAWHMPRAVGAFRRAGFAVTPYPVDFRTRGPQDVTRPFPFVAEGLRRVDLAAKEWVGLAAYRAAGYTDALFPRPTPPDGKPKR